MTNNPSPEGSGKPWNSDEIAFDNLSCKQLSALSTAFLGAFRLISYDRQKEGSAGILKAVHRMLGHHMELMNSEELPENYRKSAEEATSITILAFCLAGIASVDKVEPGRLGALATTLIRSAIELAKETGPIGPDDIILVDARVNSRDQDDELSRVELGVRLESTEFLDEVASKTEIGRLIKKIADEETKSDGPEDTNLHGPN